jgi:hypothetical protein
LEKTGWCSVEALWAAAVPWSSSSWLRRLLGLSSYDSSAAESCSASASSAQGSAVFTRFHSTLVRCLESSTYCRAPHASPSCKHVDITRKNLCKEENRYFNQYYIQELQTTNTDWAIATTKMQYLQCSACEHPLPTLIPTTKRQHLQCLACEHPLG